MILSMEVKSVELHPNADRLRIYQFSAPGVDGLLQIVANLENIYEVGDTAAVAMIDTVLEDETHIKKAKLRGELSFGMTLGSTSEFVGTDLTDAYNATTREKWVDDKNGVVEESMWARDTSIPAYLKVRDEILGAMEIIVTEKAHGSNSRFGFCGDTFLVGTHTSKIIPERLDLSTWPKGHLIHNLLSWVERNGVEARVMKWKAANPEVTSLAVYGELMGFECSDLHYGRKDTTVRMFGEVNVDGKWLDYDEAVKVVYNLFPCATADELLVPVLYRGKPDQDVLRKLRDQSSTLAQEKGEEQISEGIVIRTNPEAYSEIQNDRLIAKWKGPLYAERKTLRNRDPNELPLYLSAWDLIFDFVTDERVKHVIAKAEASGVEVHMQNSYRFAELMLDDIIKESEGEWPSDSVGLERNVLVRWTRDFMGDTLAEAVVNHQD